MKLVLFFVTTAVALQALIEASPQKKKLDLTYHPPPPPLKPTPKPFAKLNYGAEQTRGQGTNAFVDGRYKLYDNGKTKAEVFGGYDRTFGGPQDSNWNAHVGGRVEHKLG